MNASMGSRVGQRAVDHPGSRHQSAHRQGTDPAFNGSAFSFASHMDEHLIRLSAAESATGVYASPLHHHSPPPLYGESSDVTSRHSNRNFDIDAWAGGGCRSSGEARMSRVHSYACGVAGQQNGDGEQSSPPHRDPGTSLRPFSSVDLKGEGKEAKTPPLKTQEDGGLNISNFLRGAESRQFHKSKTDHSQPRGSTEQLAEEAFANVKIWREVFAAVTGMHGVYVLANFAFDNPAGGICSLFCFLCSAFAQVDRKAPSYILTALLSLFFGIVVCVSISTPVRGFEAFSENILLRRICITQVCLLFLATPVAIVVALKIMKLDSLLQEPAGLIPVQPMEDETANGCIERKDKDDAPENASEPSHHPREATACGSQEDAFADRPLSECNAT